LRVVFFDTESTALDGDWGRILCATFAELEGDPWTFRKDVKPYIGRNRVDDGRLAVAIRKELESADVLIGWNSILHDVPLLNARLADVDERPIRVGEKHGIAHIDLMYYAGGQSMKIGSRRLDNVSRFFGTEDAKTKLDGEIWQLAAAGETEAMDQVVEHCEADVLILREVWPKLAPGVKKFQFTISEVFPFLKDIASRKTG
jgi:uncharacterized protein YprB with RNaseH-like and TPR domain